MSLDLCKRLPVVLPEATMSRTIFRRVAEVLGIAGYCALHATVIPVVISLGTSLAPIDKHPRVYYLVTGAGYLLAWGVLFRALKGRRLLDRTFTRSALLDSWLGAFAVALVVTFFLIWTKLPLRFEGWNGHGFGAMGGEANVVFLPWLHLGLWLLFPRFMPRRSDRTTEGPPTLGM